MNEEKLEKLEKIIMRVENWVIGIIGWEGEYKKVDHDIIMRVILKDLKNGNKRKLRNKKN